MVFFRRKIFRIFFRLWSHKSLVQHRSMVWISQSEAEHFQEHRPGEHLNNRTNQIFERECRTLDQIELPMDRILENLKWWIIVQPLPVWYRPLRVITSGLVKKMNHQIKSPRNYHHLILGRSLLGTDQDSNDHQVYSVLAPKTPLEIDM